MEKGGREEAKIGQEKKEAGTHLLVLSFPSLEQEEWKQERSRSGGGAQEMLGTH